LLFFLTKFLPCPYCRLISTQQANVHANAKNSNDGGEQVLGACQRLRVICAFAKVGATVEFAKNILETEPAIVIFTNFASVAKAVHEQLAASGWNGELYTGETPQKKRQGKVDNFQVSLSGDVEFCVRPSHCFVARKISNEPTNQPTVLSISFSNIARLVYRQSLLAHMESLALD
jgi:SNF2 family DNA or RNA helicase